MFIFETKYFKFYDLFYDDSKLSSNKNSYLYLSFLNYFFYIPCNSADNTFV